MASKVVPTKGNLIAIKHSLALATNGYDLLDRKRNVLIKEMMQLTSKVKILRDDLASKYQEAYRLLQIANISLGVIMDIANSVSIEDTVKITYRSIMGVEIPQVTIDNSNLKMEYGFEYTNTRLDEAYLAFVEVKQYTVILAEIDNSVYRLANAIRKTQKRANALKNVVIPNMKNDIKFISDSLEEKEREEFTRLKVLKNQK
ncbi:MAG: V-type ATP synthase subunit D [Erysipelotrichaceae bacterium]